MALAVLGAGVGLDAFAHAVAAYQAGAAVSGTRVAGLAGLTGAVVKDPVQDQIVWQEYLQTVVKERDDWKDLYRASRDYAGK